MKVTEKNWSHLLNEIHVHKTSSHPNVVQVLDASRHGEFIYVILEYMPGGTLTDLIDCCITLSEAHVAYIALQLLKSLTYIHSMHRIHRDIKSDNILLGHQGEIKIGTRLTSPYHF